MRERGRRREERAEKGKNEGERVEIEVRECKRIIACVDSPH